MKFNKGLFDFIGYMSFFNPVGTGAAGTQRQIGKYCLTMFRNVLPLRNLQKNTQMSLIAWKMQKSFGRITENFAAPRTSEHLKRFAEFCEICFVQNVYQLRII